MSDIERQARLNALEELNRLVRSLMDPSAQHVVLLSDYEVANLRELFRAMGYASTAVRNPLWSAHNGDWVGQIYSKLPHVEHRPNVPAEDMAERARKFQ